MGLFHDRAHILYLNGEYSDQEERYQDIARLMHDFRECDPEKMEVPEMAEASRSLKVQKGERNNMSRALQELLDENTRIVTEEVTEQVTQAVTQTVTQTVTHRIALAALHQGIACENVAEMTGLPLEEVTALAEAE